MSIASVVPVILCGGSGTRLWPLSRQGYPKQFLKLNGELSLLQQTVVRLAHIDAICPSVLVASESQRFLVAEQMQEIQMQGHKIVLEPVQRNTAAAIATAALHAQAGGSDPVLLVLPSDHAIADTRTFTQVVNKACTAALDGTLITFGILPKGPETGYGYIKADKARDDGVRPIVQFIEKPALETAQAYVSSGNYFWNSGMFVFRASSIIAELEKFEPAIVHACREALTQAKTDADFVRLDEAAYAVNSSIALDHAVMEWTSRAGMIELDAGWDDIGSWASVWNVSAKDAQNNSVEGDALLQDCSDCLVHGTTRLVTAVGLNNIAIIETADAIMVINTDKAQQTKTLVNELIAKERREAASHRQVARPWGNYDSIGNGERFQVKKITVKQGAKLSLQMHHHRAEHWIVVSGTAKITNGDKEYLLTENQSTYIPVGAVHSLENPGKVPLELIEVQSGSYLGEDDIVRFSDLYGRA